MIIVNLYFLVIRLVGSDFYQIFNFLGLDKVLEAYASIISQNLSIFPS